MSSFDSSQPGGLNHMTATDAHCLAGVKLIAQSFFKESYGKTHITLSQAPVGREGYELRIFSPNRNEADKLLHSIFHFLPQTGNGHEAYISGDTIRHLAIWQLAKGLNNLAQTPLEIREHVEDHTGPSVYEQLSRIQPPENQLSATVSENTIIPRGLPKDASIDQCRDALNYLWAQHMNGMPDPALAVYPEADGRVRIGFEPGDNTPNRGFHYGRFIGMLEGHLPGRTVQITMGEPRPQSFSISTDMSLLPDAINRVAAAMSPTALAEVNKIGDGPGI